MQIGKIKISFNSPTILAFFALSLIAYILSIITNGWTNIAFFSVYHSSLLDPLTYVRFFTHTLGHASWEHFCGNMMMILVVGPMLEEKYGSKNILLVILVTAVVTGLVNYIFFPNVMLLGASGVVFALILMSAYVNLKNGEIPITLILVTLFYIGGQIYDGIVLNDNVSQLTHIVGGITGGGLGYVLNIKKLKAEKQKESIVQSNVS